MACFKRHLTFVFHLDEGAIKSHTILINNSKQNHQGVHMARVYTSSICCSWNQMEMQTQMCRRVDSGMYERLAKEIRLYVVEPSHWRGISISASSNKQLEYPMWSVDTVLNLQTSQWKTKCCTLSETLETVIYATSNTVRVIFTTTQSFSSHWRQLHVIRSKCSS